MAIASENKYKYKTNINQVKIIFLNRHRHTVVDPYHCGKHYGVFLLYHNNINERNMGQQNLFFILFFGNASFNNFQHAISVPTHVLVHTFNTIIRTRTFIYLFRLVIFHENAYVSILSFTIKIRST